MIPCDHLSLPPCTYAPAPAPAPFFPAPVLHAIAHDSLVPSWISLHLSISPPLSSPPLSSPASLRHRYPHPRIGSSPVHCGPGPALSRGCPVSASASGTVPVTESGPPRLVTSAGPGKDSESGTQMVRHAEFATRKAVRVSESRGPPGIMADIRVTALMIG
eukprot:766653-Hanusia_phi.AAC.8